jgi:hypothetical protein
VPLGVRDVLIADRGYGRAKELVALSFRVVFWLVRVYLPSVPLWNKRNEHLDSRELVRARSKAGRAIEREVEVCYGARCVRARLIIAPLPPEAAAKARAKVRKRASKKGKKVDAQAEWMAGFVTLLTTVDSKTASIAAVLNWYRVRWQIELYFKRCKSLLQLHPVLSADDDMMDLQCAVAGDQPLAQKRRRNRVIWRATRERPRTRHRAHSDATMRRMHDALRSASQNWC